MLQLEASFSLTFKVDPVYDKHSLDLIHKMTRNRLQVAIEFQSNFTKEEVKNQCILSSSKAFSSDKVALFFQPVSRRSDQIFDDDIMIMALLHILKESITK